jgi:anion-transporting  ArsA/GET3 family ATPase
LSSPTLVEKLVRTRRVVVVVGPGGVGKTSVAAALALASARPGRRVLCLTIDPARRLAQALGVLRISSEVTPVPAEWLAAHGAQPGARVDVMMLDVERALVELITARAGDSGRVAQITGTRAFEYLARNLSGMQSYMAIEKVLDVFERSEYDHIILDTPPSSRAVDFFDAPRRMQELVDSPLTRTLSSVTRLGSSVGGAVLARGARLALRGLGRVTGTGLMEELAEILGAFGELLGGARQRAGLLSDHLASPAFGYVLITTPTLVATQEATDLAWLLRRRNLRLDGCVVNRVTPVPRPLPSDSELDALLGTQSAEESQTRRARLDAAWARERLVNSAEESLIQSLRGALPGPLLWAELPRISGEIHEPEPLARLADSLG